MGDWISVEDRLPVHAQAVRTKGADGREFDCNYWHWSDSKKGHFKVIGYVWEHDKVTHWKPATGDPK